jgi:hypothetical protein
MSLPSLLFKNKMGREGKRDLQCFIFGDGVWVRVMEYKKGGKEGHTHKRASLFLYSFLF